MGIAILRIQRDISPFTGYARSNITQSLASDPDLSGPLLAWLIDCPVEALTVSPVGPVLVVHGGSWAAARELQSLRWPYCGGTTIHGRAVGVSRRRRQAPWEPLSFIAARKAQDLLLRLSAPLLQAACPIHESFEQQLPWDELVHFRASDPAGQAEIREEHNQRRRQAQALDGRLP
jgi:hypothetical protein